MNLVLVIIHQTLLEIATSCNVSTSGPFPLFAAPVGADREKAV